MTTLLEALERETCNDRDGETVLTVDDALAAVRRWLAEEQLAVVPIKSTRAMYDAAEPCVRTAFRGGYQADQDAVWAAMLAAAPDMMGER